jgi:hypothetical protein
VPAELIFILIIVALSLLGNVAKQPPRPPPQVPPRVPEGDPFRPEREPAEPGVGVPPATWLPGPPAGPRAPAPVFWDEEEEPEEEERPPLEVVPAFESVSLEPAARADDVAPRPEPVRPVLEATEVDRQAEHARLHRTIEGAPPPSARAPGTLSRLRDHGMLRRAVVAAEVLGPPLALRPPDER